MAINEREKRFAKLMKWHHGHIGLYHKVAKKMGLSPSYVSLVANGARQNEKITQTLANELERLVRATPGRRP